MRVWLIGLALLAGCAERVEPPASAPVAITAGNADRLRQAGGDILFWSQAERDARFPAMETIFPGHIAKASKRPLPLPPGAPLAFDAAAHVTAHNVAGLIVLQDGRVRLERYARDHSRERRYTSFSVAKSLTSTLVGAALKDGLIKSVSDPLTRYLPELRGSGYDGVTVEKVLTMTSGVRWNENYADPNSDVVRMYSTAPPTGVDPTIAYLQTLPSEAAPGTKWRYKTGETNLIGVLVTRVTGKSLADYASEKIWRPFGMESDLFWMMDPSGQDIGGCCLSASLRDYARLGLFALGGGKGVVPQGWFAKAATRQSGTPARGYGYQWWTNADGSYQAQGIFGQMIYVDPARRLVVAVSSSWPAPYTPTLHKERADFIQQINAAVDAER